MKLNNNSFKLIIPGNTNVSAMINAIIRATLEARMNTKNDKLVFCQVHIFHTEQSLQSLMTTELPWKQALQNYGISTTILIHHVTKIEDSNIDRFRDLVKQLRTIVNPLDSSYYYVDLTGGISALKTILAVFAYVINIEHIYSLEIKFSSETEIRKKQMDLFYYELEKENVTIEYRKFPPINEFDSFGKLNYTEVIRHREFIANLIENLKAVIPSEFDLEHLHASLMSGVNSLLLGEVTGDLG